MRFLADENLARDIVAWLRANDHDVAYAAELQPGAIDTEWADLAEKEDRIVLTADKDFGEIIYRGGLSRCGVVLLRLDNMVVSDALARLQSIWAIIEANPNGKFIVVTEKKVRVRPMPTTE